LGCRRAGVIRRGRETRCRPLHAGGCAPPTLSPAMEEGCGPRQRHESSNFLVARHHRSVHEVARRRSVAKPDVYGFAVIFRLKMSTVLRWAPVAPVKPNHMGWFVSNCIHQGVLMSL
jgi:hypothetical protein